MTALVHPFSLPGVVPLRGVVRGCYASDDGTIWSAPVGLLPLSTSANAAELTAALAAMNLTLTRPSVATVQTSAFTVVTSNILANVPRVGSNGTNTGLVIEEQRSNLLNYSAPGSVGDITVALASVTPTTGPDGTTTYAARLVDSDPATIGYVAKPTPAYTPAAPYVASWWVKDVSGAAGVTIGFNVNDAAVGRAGDPRPIAAGWNRKVYAYNGGATGAPSSYVCIPAYVAGATGTADFGLIQKESGAFATEAIITTGATATRSADKLTISSSDLIVRDGRLKFMWTFVPKGSVAQMNGGAGFYLFSNALGTTRSYMIRLGGIDKLSLDVAGVGLLSTNGGPLMAALDSVRLYVEVGNGAPYAAISINGAVRTVYTFPAGSHAAFPSTSGLYLMSAPTNGPSCWLQGMVAYERRPSWAT